MIRSKAFLLFGVFFLLLVLITYSLVDFREREDRAYDYFTEEDYEALLALYPKLDNSFHERELSILSQTISRLEERANAMKSPRDLLYRLKNKGKLKIVEWETNRGVYYHIEDPYFPLLKKHGIAYKRALIERGLSLKKPIPKKEITQLLLLLVLEDPRGLEESYSKALTNLLSYPFEPIGEIELGFLSETLQFLASTQSSVLFQSVRSVRGSNINLRSGPGRENSEVGKVSDPDSCFVLEVDETEETIAEIVSHWNLCYFPKLQKSAWIFGGFLREIPVDDQAVSSFQKRFKAIENEIRIDFEGWTGKKIPNAFYGTYLPREAEREAGETGFPVYGTTTKGESQYERICKKVAGDKNYFEFSFHPTNSATLVRFLELHLVYAGKSHTAYTIAADQEAIEVNQNRYLLDGEKRRENLSLHIESRSKDKLKASLWRRNTGLVFAISSLPLEESILQSGRYSWEICLPLVSKPNKEKVLLFEIRTGVH